MSLSPSNIKSVVTYDTSAYGEDLEFPMMSAGLTLQNFTISDATITRDTDDGAQPIDADSFAIDDRNNGMIEHEGNNTQYSQTFRFNPDMSAVVYKTRFHLAMGLNVSAYTSGNFNIGDLTIKVVETASSDRVIYENTFPSGATNQTATGVSYHIFDQDVIEPFKIYRGQPIDITLTLNSSAGTGTRQEGLVSYFPTYATARPKIFHTSAISFHVHASMDHADPVYRTNVGRISRLGQ